MFVLKHVVFMEKKVLLEDSGGKVELREVQDAQIDADHLTKPEAVIQSDEERVDPSKAQALHRTSRIRIILERYGFLFNE